MRFSRLLLLLALGIAVVPSLYAENLGRAGPVYAIEEKDLLEWIYERLRKMEANGEFGPIQEKMKERLVSAAMEPKPVDGLTRTTKPRTFLVDPGILLEHDIQDQAGNVIVKAGTYRNPLEISPLRQKLYFFDASDSKQRLMAKRFYENERVKPKLILVKGKPLDLSEEWDIRLYFDQLGMLVKRLQISQVPAVVSQEGVMLRVDEIKVQ